MGQSSLRGPKWDIDGRCGDGGRIPVTTKVAIAARLATSWLESLINIDGVLPGVYMPLGYRCRRYSAACMVACLR
jgi:hypothetical protein